MQKLTTKSSTVFIATGESTLVYRSVRDVPPSLRRRLEESTGGANSATILIADKRGKEELVRALRGLPSDVQSRLANTIHAQRRAQPTAAPKPESRRPWKLLAEILIPAGVGFTIWLLVTTHF
jgi:hypothetical protein